MTKAPAALPTRRERRPEARGGGGRAGFKCPAGAVRQRGVSRPSPPRSADSSGAARPFSAAARCRRSVPACAAPPGMGGGAPWPARGSARAALLPPPPHGAAAGSRRRDERERQPRARRGALPLRPLLRAVRHRRGERAGARRAGRWAWRPRPRRCGSRRACGMRCLKMSAPPEEGRRRGRRAGGSRWEGATLEDKASSGGAGGASPQSSSRRAVGSAWPPGCAVPRRPGCADPAGPGPWRWWGQAAPGGCHRQEKGTQGYGIGGSRMTELFAGADGFSSVSALERRGRDLGRTEYINGIASFLCLFTPYVYSEIVFPHSSFPLYPKNVAEKMEQNYCCRLKHIF